MNCFRLSILFLFIASGITGQVQLNNSNFSLKDRTEDTGIPATDYYIQSLSAGEEYTIEINSPVPFSCIGVAWKTSAVDLLPGSFHFTYRTKNGNSWSEWMDAHGHFTPQEIPSGHYRTDLLFSSDATAQNKIQIKYSPEVNISEMQINLFDGTTEEKATSNAPTQTQSATSRNCPQLPTIIPRAAWCGGNAPCNNVLSSYTPININPTHVAIHHGASPNTYTNGEAVVQNYWNYHVNYNGWADIGYNYLVDKYGNLYQGRHNPNMPTTDVRGAHAGAANNDAIGICFLGNLDVTTATTPQLDVVYDFLGWWFNYKGYDPTTSAALQTQAYGVQVEPRIIGHTDLGTTLCPGSNLHSQLPNVRLEVQAVIDACNNTNNDVTAPTTAGNTYYEWRGHDFWMNFDDNDNTGGSGVDKTYYQVIDYDGSEWRANSDYGFFNDNFNTAIHSEWTAASGSWSIDNSNLRQSDQSNTNTNIYAEVNQEATNAYLYQWSMYVDGTGLNRRGGLHFFVDDPTQPNRGNSYLAWYRMDDNEYHLYEVTNDNLNLLVVEPVTLNTGTWYDIKVTFDPGSGEIATWIDNNLINTYVDGTPITTGSHISLRNGDSDVRFEDFKVRKARIFEEKVTVGNTQKEVRYESPNNQQDACRINTVINDAAGNWSSQDAKNIYIDWTSPATVGSAGGNWQTADFTTTFNDTDNNNGSGIMKSFYQVIDFDGSDWRANTDNGFFSDNFDQAVIHPDWTTVSGSWNVTNGHLEQTDEAVGNTNIYASLKQDLSNRYLYHFQMKLSGSGNNKRGGLHYFCDDPTQTNRGNSYFVWFRQELQTLEFYKVTNDTFTQEKVVPIEFTENVWMDVKVVFDRITGETFVYKDDKLIGEWLDDSNPHSSGDYVSFRSGNSNMDINNFKVYRSRFPQVTVTVGNTSSDIRYQSPDPNTIAAKVKSIVQDSAQNLSAIDYLDLYIDWSAPDEINSIADGSAADIDTFYTSSEITANWSASTDPHSDISHYEMSIGTQPGQTNALGWQNVGNTTSATLNGLALTPAVMYFINIRPVNGAGITGNMISSDGQFLFSGAGLDEIENSLFSIYPNPVKAGEDLTLSFSESATKDVDIRIQTSDGKLVYEREEISTLQGSYTISSLGWAQGVYLVQLTDGTGNSETRKIIISE